jgi:hypothetical protein
MNPDKNILQELNEISPIVAGIPKSNPYAINEGYFDANMLDLLKITGNGSPYLVPENYFENLSINISLHDSEGLEHPENQTGFNTQETPYQVPENYFQNFEKNLMSQLSDQSQKGALVRMNKWIKWSAAACIAGLLGWALFFSINKNNQNDEWRMSWNEAQTIIKNGSFESELNQINTNELANYLTEQGHDVDAAVMACIDEESTQNDEWIYMESEKEIEAFLNDTKPLLN